MRALTCLMLAACGGGASDIETSAELDGGWAIKSGQPDGAADHVSFEDNSPGFAFTLTSAGGTFGNGTYNVQVPEGLVLLFPVTPANTTWCSPGATIDGDTLCFDPFDADLCGLAVGRVPVESPVVGCYARD